MLEAIIFDFDGTILDTELHDYHSWRELFLEHTVELPFERWIDQVGTVSTFDPYHLLGTLTGKPIDRAQISGRRRQRFLDLVQSEALRPGVEALIVAAHNAGLRLGVASSGTRDWVEAHLQERGLRQYFGVVRTSNDVQRVKPDPELYRSALEILGVAPQNAWAVEDSRHGMLAAKAAGMKCLVVPNEITQGLDFSEADLLLDSLVDVNLQQLA